MTLTTVLFLAGMGLLAGFIDSIAGGGGLITVPALATVLGAGALTVGTNKIVGGMAALAALLVYLRQGHFDFRSSLGFALWVWAGSFLGSLVGTSLPQAAFTVLLLITCPLILWLVWMKDFWVQREATAHVGKPRFRANWKMALAGLACGIYDGAWGPGGGTFMFLSLLIVGRQPLLTAMAATKLANTGSALFSLFSYAWQGYVDWPLGLVMALGVTAGAFIGATQATRQAARIVRPLLAVVVMLLLVRLFVFRG